MTDCDSSEIWAIGFCKKHYAQNYHRINYEQTRRGCLAGLMFDVPGDLDAHLEADAA
jgi:hypothetical protein